MLVHPAIAAYLVQGDGHRVKYLEQKYGLNIQVQDDYHLHREDFRILGRKEMVEVVVPE